MNKILYIEIYGFALSILILMVVMMLSKKYVKFTFEKKLFLLLLLFDAVALIGDLGSWLLDGLHFPYAQIVHYIDYTIFFIFSAFVFLFWYLNEIYILYRSKAMIKKRLPIHIAVMVIYLLVTTTSPFTHLVYYVTPDNTYVRGPFFIFIFFYSLFMMGSMVFESFYYFIKYKNTHNVLIYIDIIILPIVEVICVILQTLFYGLTLIWPATAIGFLFLYLMVQDREMATDPLTHLKNRREMEFSMVYKVKTYNKKLFLMSFDLHNFKKINDIYGHQMGDIALELAAKVLNDSITKTDDLVFRTGGDEFAIIGERDSIEEIEKLRKLINLNAYLTSVDSEYDFEIKFDSGFAIYDKTKSTKDWIDEADKAMYLDKEQNSNEKILTEEVS